MISLTKEQKTRLIDTLKIAIDQWMSPVISSYDPVIPARRRESWISSQAFRGLCPIIQVHCGSSSPEYSWFKEQLPKRIYDLDYRFPRTREGARMRVKFCRRLIKRLKGKRCARRSKA